MLPYAAFACADGADALKEFAEVVLAERGVTLLEAFVVEYESFAYKLVENARGPLAEHRGASAVDAVPDTYNGIEGIKYLFAFNPSGTFLLNYFHFGNSCVCIKLFLFIDIGQMLVYGRNSYAKKLSHGFLGEP